MRNIKLIFSEYDKETGVSTVVLKDKKGNFFTAKSTLLEEDRDIESSFAGCRFAETKAYLKMLKNDIKELKKEIKAIENLEKYLKNVKEYDDTSAIAKKIRRYKYHTSKKIAAAEERYNDIKEYTMKEMHNYRSRVERIKKGRNK